MSAIEAASNVAIGYLVAVAANAVMLPMFGMYPSTADSLAIGALFTIISLLRSYALRRAFNALRDR
jgi:hypothetical protein